MSDRSLRLHERAALAGDPDAEARHLRARVRAGTLSRVKLRLAAYCGHEAARLVAEPFFRDGTLHTTLGVSSKPTWEMTDEWYDDGDGKDWLADLRSVATDLDAGKREELCSACNPHRLHKAPCHCGGCYCSKCGPTGIRLVPRDGGEWVQIQAAIASGWLALPKWERSKENWVHEGNCESYTAINGCFMENCCGACDYDPRPRRALEAAQHYQGEPTLEAREVWDVLSRALLLDWVLLAGSDHATTIQAAARVVGGTCPGCHVAGCEWGPKCTRVNGDTKVRAAICSDLIERSLK